jgi:8-oxo-dGTP pyrophosphatase MutT (NUDIX family)
MGNLRVHPPRLLEAQAHLRSAAVGIVLLPMLAERADDDASRAAFVLTLRLPTLRRHAGQWALPGGRLDPHETPEAAARREIAEEIGLHLAPDDVLGRLDDFPSRSGHLISPFVVWAERAQAALVPNPDEVHAAFRVPLDDLDLPGNPRREPLLHFALVGSTVYAPTAAILFQFREVALHGRAVHVADTEQPFFAWR